MLSECVTYLLYPFVTCGATDGWEHGNLGLQHFCGRQHLWCIRREPNSRDLVLL